MTTPEAITILENLRVQVSGAKTQAAITLAIQVLKDKERRK